jgi:hypothetical protein
MTDYSLTLEEIEAIAIRRLAESENDEEEWSFVFRTPGSEKRWYFSVDEIDGWEFEPEMTDFPGLTWAKERKEMLSSCEDDPTESELNEWQIAKAKWGIQKGDEGASQAFVVPVIVDILSLKVGPIEKEVPVIAGYVNVDCGPMIDAFREPGTEGAFRTKEEAFEALRVDRVFG